ncbi:MAG: FIST C-terminal domain-containing protein [Proteobacteria bacterium]|nr:FIST C-terminal domain-containing protein [Pseudomonadota bacterium]
MGVGSGRTGEEALAAATADVRVTSTRAAWLAFSGVESQDASGLVEQGARALECENVLGTSVDAVLADDGVDAPVRVAVLASEDPDGSIVSPEEPEAGAAGLCEAIRASLDGEARAGDFALVAVNPDELDMAEVAAVLKEELPGLTTAGFGVGAGVGHGPWLHTARDEAAPWAAAWVVRHRAPARFSQSPSWRVAGRVSAVTRGRGRWIEQLDGERALTVFESVAQGRLAEDFARASRFVLLRRATAEGPAELLRIAGCDRRRGSLSVSDPIRSGERLEWLVCDGRAAREDLQRQLGETAQEALSLRLFLSCASRTDAFFGLPDLEAALLHGGPATPPTLALRAPVLLGPGPVVVTHAALLAQLP